MYPFSVPAPISNINPSLTRRPSSIHGPSGIQPSPSSLRSVNNGNPFAGGMPLGPQQLSIFDEPGKEGAGLNYLYPQIFKNPNSSLSRYLLSPTNTAGLRSGYDAAVVKDKNLSFLDWLSAYDPVSKFNSLAPSQRGENPSLYAPRVRLL